jgi:mycofactocin system glycosyltransferase
VIIGGYPIRVLRLTEAGAAMVDAWGAGSPIAASQGAQALATRLLEAGVAHPRPDPSDPEILRSADVTVVIPVLNNPSGLAATLTSLAGTGIGSVIVVDDGSTPPLDESSPEPGTRVIRRDRTGGPGAARNAAWPECSTPVVVFLDADCVPAEGWLDALLPHFRDPQVAAVAPRVVAVPDWGTPPILAAYESRRSPLDLGPAEADVHPGSRVPYVPTAALAVRISALSQAGGFDETLKYGEDVDLVWRLRKMGWRVRYEPATSVTHPVRPNYRAWLKQRYGYGCSAADLAARHGRDVAPLAGSPWSAAPWALAWAGHPIGAAALSAGSAIALGRRAGHDRATSKELAGLAVKGTLSTGRSLADALRRAWLPIVLAAGVALRGNRSRLGRRLLGSVCLALIADPAVEWKSTNPGPSLPAWLILRLADDLAYQAGVWRGVVRRRSAAALWPRW